jgi:hypothetical protein
VTQYYKHGKSTFKEESQADIQTCLREIFAEYDAEYDSGYNVNAPDTGFTPVGVTPGAMYADPGYYGSVPVPVVPPTSSAAWMLPVVQTVVPSLPPPPCAVRTVRVVTPDSQETWAIPPVGTGFTTGITADITADITAEITAEIAVEKTAIMTGVKSDTAFNLGKSALPYIGDMNDFM